MSSPAISLLLFGIYLVVNGLACAFVPNTLLGMFGQAPTLEPWIRNAGVLMLVIGFYYIMAARVDLKPFYLWTVYGRAGTFLIFLLFIALCWAPTTLELFAAIGILGALWTYLALRAKPSVSWGGPAPEVRHPDCLALPPDLRLLTIRCS